MVLLRARRGRLAIVYWLAPRVRKIAQFTVPDILETCYNAASRVLGTVAIIIAYFTIAGCQFIGGGGLLNILTGVDPVKGQFIIALLVVAYTIVAGMASIVPLDLFNGLLITAGGWQTPTTTLPETHFSLFGALGPASATRCNSVEDNVLSAIADAGCPGYNGRRVNWIR